MSESQHHRPSVVERIATDPVLATAARFMQLVVLPIAAWLFLQVWNGIGDIRDFIHRLDNRIAVEERRSIETDRRLEFIERQCMTERSPAGPLPTLRGFDRP